MLSKVLYTLKKSVATTFTNKLLYFFVSNIVFHYLNFPKTLINSFEH